MLQDKGQQALEMDIKTLLSEVIDGDYHDFASDAHATPKMALVSRLEEIKSDCINGKYDNTYNNDRR